MTLFQRLAAATTVVACIFFFPIAAISQTAVSPSEAATVANNYLQLGQEMNWGWTSSAALTAASAHEVIGGGERVAYCLNVPTGGYIVVPAYRELPPVTAYSFESAFNPDADGGFCAMVREELAAKLSLVRQCLNQSSKLPAEWATVRQQIDDDRQMWTAYAGSYDDFTQEITSKDERMQSSTPRHGGRYSIDDVGQLLTTTWHQSPPYNGQCPMGDGGRTVVGCVATACSQIMAFWRYPTSGSGSHTYSWNGDQSCGHNVGASSLTGNYSDSYDWPNILDNYTGSEPQIQKDAVAELCYEVASALNTDFGACGSAASTGSVASILPLYFGYESGAEVRYRTSYSTAAAWFSMLQEDLNLGRPMQYRIQSHSIVCDGWRVSGSNQIHLNYGWADGHTAWYTVDNLYCTWSGCSPTVEYVVRHIYPAGTLAGHLDLTTPDGGETWAVGEQDSIEWISHNVSGNVRIELNRNYPSGQWEVLSSSAPNSGVFTWTVTAPACEAARARITSLTDPTICDTSDANFSAAFDPPLVVVQYENNAIRLAWSADGGPYYKVYSSSLADGPFTTLEGSTSDTTFVDNEPLQDRKFYKVTSSTTP